MSQDKENISKLIEFIQEGLKNYSVNELNNAILESLKKHRKEQYILHIDLVLQIVSDEYKISRQTLLKTKRGRGDVQDAKDMAYSLLHYTLGLSIRYIAQNIFFCFPNSITIGVKKIRNANHYIKHEKELLDRFRLLNEKIIAAIDTKKQLQHIEHENIS